MKLKDTSIADYARIRVGVMSGFLTAMLVMDAIAITLTVGILDIEVEPLQRVAASLLVFAAGTGVLLFFLARRYVESVTYKFASIEDIQMDAISKIARRFYLPFLMCLLSNIFLAALGALILLTLLFV